MIDKEWFDKLEDLPPKFAKSIDDVMYEDSLKFEDQNVVPSITFYDGEKEIGKLEWKDEVFSFSGKADESAKIFFNCLKELWSNYEKTTEED